jgi:hypothetical protein
MATGVRILWVLLLALRIVSFCVGDERVGILQYFHHVGHAILFDGDGG